MKMYPMKLLLPMQLFRSQPTIPLSMIQILLSEIMMSPKSLV